ncbi:hypothetical protein U1E44_12925 [Arenibacter sp. GZD96]|uniref:hypothetical protein n=1 Tax=Aurantibrevibacter litoralis TaxID=3106030 RepID=UPI002AFDE5ED|nr:hypothetical protein [Arenibacter sp. GZD-96]MEA1786999.1 hypothetical protein [Arenibacter sp. GZD-96]
MIKEIQQEIKTNRTFLKGIGILEIVGGITGIGLIIWLMLQESETNTLVLLILLIAVGFYFYSIYAGIILFKKLENGVLHSLVLQYLQIPAFSIGGFTYIMTSGGYFLLGFNFATSSINFSFALIASKFQIDILTNSDSAFIKLNLLAILVLALIENSLKKIMKYSKLKANYDRNMNEWLNPKN